MKPAAIGATLLLHTATLGVIIHLGTDQRPPRSVSNPLEIVMISGSSATHPTIPAPEKNAIRNLSISDQSALERNRTEPPTMFKAASISVLPVHGSTTGNVTDTSSASGATSGTSQKSSVSIPASYALSNSRPVYPWISVKQEEQGTVHLHILVQPDGTAGQVKVSRSSGYPLLDESALGTVQNWRFRPATVNNKPVAEWYRLAIPFKLNKS